MKWTTEAKVGAFSLAGIILFTIIIVHLSTLVIFGRSGFLLKKRKASKKETRSIMLA